MRSYISNYGGNRMPENSFDSTEFKHQLNSFMVQHAPGWLTLNQAESAMLAMIESIEKATNV